MLDAAVVAAENATPRKRRESKEKPEGFRWSVGIVMVACLVVVAVTATYGVARYALGVGQMYV